MDLISTMIVEDEALILKDITRIIDWEKNGFKIVATALNGVIGLKKYEQYKPALILTDIKMPGLNGLDMIKSIQNLSFDTKFIVVSSYSDFDYAMEAIKLGAKDYILKSELSAEYLEEKLKNFKQNHFIEKDMLKNSLENKITKMLSNISEITREDIHTLFETPYHEIINENAEDYYNIIMEALKKQYDQFHIIHMFQPHPFNNFETMEDQIIFEIQQLKELSAICTSNNYSAPVIHAINYINQHFSDPNLNINEIANAMNISYSRLCVLFKNETNTSINNFITDKRVSEAKKLLYLKNMKVYEVSKQIGYMTSQYFSKVFYQKTGQYPNDFRNKYLSEENS